MSYQVLARKWRPRRFAELVGQEHVVRALSNALDSGRVHHAFLFTGTRGVGKTTIARIFAKSLNCEQGVGADPCGTCSVCTAVDAGRFVDLLEIDAASNTGVDDVREVIENAQYMPSVGRYKVYLVDEVHMLSKSAFNALLKTLEEPPAHVKFLLATTDPQKLPVTVLSRCLQFSLKRLGEDQIAGQMRHILGAEAIAFDDGAIGLLAHAADGSLRDGLSLLDQAIAFGGGSVRDADVRSMLGTIDRGSVGALLDALALGDGEALLDEVARMAEVLPDLGSVLQALAEALHRIALAQVVPQAGERCDEKERYLAQRLSPEFVQLLYQLAVTGDRELVLAPSLRVGLEMVLLRMLAFRPPDANGAGARPSNAATGKADGHTAAAVSAASVRQTESKPERPPSMADGLRTPVAPATQVREAQAPADAGLLEWMQLMDAAGLRGPTRELASHCTPLSQSAGQWILAIHATLEHLVTASAVERLEQALSAHLGQPQRVRIETTRTQHDTPAAQASRISESRQRGAEDSVRSDALVNDLVTRFDARVIPQSIRPMEE